MATPKKKAPTRRKSKPLPSLIAPKVTWRIKESQTPSTNLVDGVVAVPLGVGEVDRARRNQEMLKVKFSPKKLAQGKDIDPNVMEACENVRVRHRGQYLGVDFGEDIQFLSDAQIMDVMSNGSETEIAAMAMNAWETGDWMRVYHAATATGHQQLWIHVARAMSIATNNWRKTPGPINAAKAARYLTQLLSDPPDDPDDKTNNTSGKPEAANVPSEVRESLQRVAHYADFDDLNDQERDGETEVLTKTGYDEWCPMTVTEPKRTIRFPSKMRGRSWKATDQGVVLRYPQRYCADKTMFAARAQKPGGCTVLVDASGSMHVSPQDIWDIMKLMPAAVIATYNGNERTGELRVVAKKGRRVDNTLLKPSGGYNSVDGPALAWLSKQPGPRYWVSDGYINGYDGAQTPAMFAAVYKHCRDSHILRVNNLTEVIERFG